MFASPEKFTPGNCSKTVTCIKEKVIKILCYQKSLKFIKINKYPKMINWGDSPSPPT